MFGEGCEAFFPLREFVTDADLFFDVVLHNRTKSAEVVSGIGVEIVEVMSELNVYGIPEAAVIEPSTDVYEIDMPDLRRGRDGCNIIYPVDKRLGVRMRGPIYMEPQAPYRYELHLKDYQVNVPNHARLRLIVKVGQDVGARTLSTSSPGSRIGRWGIEHRGTPETAEPTRTNRILRQILGVHRRRPAGHAGWPCTRSATGHPRATMPGYASRRLAEGVKGVATSDGRYVSRLEDRGRTPAPRPRTTTSRRRTRCMSGAHS